MKDLILTEQVAADIRARVKSLDFKAIEKLRRAKDENGTFDVIISTEDLDRAGEIVRQDGWELGNYKNNPIVLWGHDYYSLPIGVCTETYKTNVHGVPATGAKGVFYPADINPLAQQVRRMYEFGQKHGVGVGCTTSVGFIPKEFDEENQRVITRAELLEFSFVPIPANQGVGPAEGRAFTFEEAKELGLDVAELRTKGIEFVAPEVEETKKEAQAGDDCTTDDGSPGVLTSDRNDPDGSLVCLPQEQDKSAMTAGGNAQKALLKAVADEHERHTGEVEKALDDYREKCSGMEGDEKAHADGKREAVKDLRASLADEHTMHRANSIATFRSFEAGDEKAFDRNEHLKALRGEHDAYEGKCMNALTEFEEKSAKATDEEHDGHLDTLGGKLETAQRSHKKAVNKIAKGMCRDAFGEEDQADEKTLEILKEYLAPHIDAQLLPAVAAKIGAKLSAATKANLAEAHEHLKAASAVVEALHGGFGNDDGEESRSTDDTSSAPAPAKKRSRPTEAPVNHELNDFMFSKEVLREVTTAAQKGLAELNKRGKH